MSPMKPSSTLDLNKNERSLLLYLETCLVDGLGRVESIRMNKTDFTIIKKWKNTKFIAFGRLRFKAIERLRKYGHQYTHYVRLSEEAWALVHQLRRERSDRLISKENVRLIKEVIKIEELKNKEFAKEKVTFT